MLEHKDYYFLASVDFLKQSEGRKIIINIKHSPIVTFFFTGMYLQYHQIFCFKIPFLLLKNIIFVGGPHYIQTNHKLICPDFILQCFRLRVLCVPPKTSDTV